MSNNNETFEPILIHDTNSYYNSLDNVFVFLKETLFPALLLSKYKDFKFTSNYTDFGNHSSEGRTKNIDFVPDMSDDEFERRLIVKNGRDNFNGMTVADKDAQKPVIRTEYETEYKTKFKTSKNSDRFTIPDNYISLTLNHIFETNLWTPMDTLHVGKGIDHTIFGDSFNFLKISKNNYKYSLNCIIHNKDLVKLVDIAATIKNNISINKKFKIQDHPRLKVRIADDFLVQYMPIFGFTKKSQVLDYIQNGNPNFFEEKDLNTGEHRALFHKMVIDPYYNLNSMELDEANRKLNLSFDFEMFLPSRIYSGSYLTAEELRLLAIDSKMFSLVSLQKIAKERIIEFCNLMFTEKGLEVAKRLAKELPEYTQYQQQLASSVLSSASKEAIIAAIKLDMCTKYAAITDPNELERLLIKYIIGNDADALAIYISDYSVKATYQWIINVDPKFLEKYKVDLGLSDQDIRDIALGNKHFFIDLSIFDPVTREQLSQYFLGGGGIVRSLDINMKDAEDTAINKATIVDIKTVRELGWKSHRVFYFDNFGKQSISKIRVNDTLAANMFGKGEYPSKLKFVITDMSNNEVLGFEPKVFENELVLSTDANTEELYLQITILIKE
jgi:hypothetical protein